MLNLSERANNLSLRSFQNLKRNGYEMDNVIQDLTSIYTEEISLSARKCIIKNIWDNVDKLPEQVIVFKDLFKRALRHIRSGQCTPEDKYQFLEAIFNGELRILLHEVIEIKRIDYQNAEDICQDILISIFQRVVGDKDVSSIRGNNDFQILDDDYKSFVFYCLKVIKNHGNQKYRTNIRYKVEEYL